MKFCVVEIQTQTASFRNPEFQNYHKSFKLPPPTTLVGLAGAALGLSPNAAQNFFNKFHFKMGVYGTSEGISTDLWKYNDFKQKSIIKKEILFLNKLIVIYGSEDESSLIRLKDAFLSPEYALTLGSSDSLAFVKDVLIIDSLQSDYKVEYCILEGDVIAEVTQNLANNLELSIYSTSDPITYDLPTRFIYESDYGMRSVSERKVFSFIGKPMQLNIKKEGVRYKDKFIPVFTY